MYEIDCKAPASGTINKQKGGWGLGCGDAVILVDWYLY